MEKLIDRITFGTQLATTKRKTVKRKKKAEDYDHGDDEEEELETPRKKQKHSAVSTPRKVRTPSAKFLTPSHKRCVSPPLAIYFANYIQGGHQETS